METWLKWAAATALGACFAVACAPNPFVHHYFGEDLSSRRCYARAYSPDYLDAHPDHAVSSIALAGAGIIGPQREMTLRYAIRLRDRPEVRTGLVVCQQSGVGARCFLECDGGDFSLEPAGFGIQLTVGERWMAEGEGECSVDLRSARDRVFVLHQASATTCATQ